MRWSYFFHTSDFQMIWVFSSSRNLFLKLMSCRSFLYEYVSRSHNSRKRSLLQKLKREMLEHDDGGVCEWGLWGRGPDRTRLARRGLWQEEAVGFGGDTSMATCSNGSCWHCGLVRIECSEDLMWEGGREWESEMSKEEGGGGGDAQAQYVGPYRLEKTLGKGQTGECSSTQKGKDVVEKTWDRVSGLAKHHKTTLDWC